MKFWLIKSEPFVYSWQQFKKEKRSGWEGVRNYGARNNLRDMKKGDLAFFYHSNEGLAIVGIAKVVKEAFQDPTSDNPAWLSVEFSPFKEFKTPVTLEQIKADPSLQNMDLVRLGRLSVGKVTEHEFVKVCDMAGLEF